MDKKESMCHVRCHILLRHSNVTENKDLVFQLLTPQEYLEAYHNDAKFIIEIGL